MAETQKQTHKELLGVLLVRETGSHNKFLRMRWEQKGAELYFSKVGPGTYRFSKDPSEGQKVTVKQVTAPPIFRYINVHNMIDEEGYMSVFRNENGDYLVRESTDEEARRHSRRIRPFGESGQCRTPAIYTTNAVALTNEDNKRLWKTPTLAMKVVMTDSKLFIEAKAVSEREAALYPTYTEAVSCYGGHANLRTMKEVTLLYKLEYTETYHMRLPVPISFARRTGMTDQDILKTWFKDDGTMVIEGKPLYCDCCGREINRYFDLTNYVCTCADCEAKLESTTDAQKRVIKQAQPDEYDNILAELKDLKRQMIEKISLQKGATL